MNSSPKVPMPTLERLATYLRYLIEVERSGAETISSAAIEAQTGINAAQFRKDLSYFGDFGRPGVGYNATDLRERIAQILQMDKMQPMIVIGAGNLGSALIGYPGLHENNFHLVAAFDSAAQKIGRRQGELIVQNIANLREANRTLQARIAILAVPAETAQSVAEEAIESGISLILNFAPVTLKTPPNVLVRNVSLLQELAVLSYHNPSEATA